MYTNTIETNKLKKYVFHNLPVKLNTTGKIVILSGYTQKKGFVHGLSEFAAGDITPMFLPIVSTTVENNDGITPLIRLFGIATNNEYFSTGKISHTAHKIELYSTAKTPGKCQASLKYYDQDSSDPKVVVFTLTENRGFCLYVINPNGEPIICPVADQEYLLSAAYDSHIWLGNQNIFHEGLAIPKISTGFSTGVGLKKCNEY